MPDRIARVLQDISEIPEDAWNRCANAAEEYNPFLDHRFLRVLEQSGSVSSRTGWQPFHLCLAEGESVLGVVPMYLKSHSRGEYVFDGGWADAWYRAGGEYYPKLQSSVPFTPATGRRLLASDAGDIEQIEDQLLAACVQVANQLEVSSLHFTFMPKSQWERSGSAGMLQRIDQQFHWQNAGYSTFDDFLANLSSKKRKNIRRERRGAVENDIEIEWVTGNDLTEYHWDCFYRFYTDTGERKWGTPYLNRLFFSLLGEAMSEKVLLIMCKRNGRYIAGAINFIGSHALFGRNWGCSEDHRFLHFETCYYQAIEFAIAHGLQRVEAGAQGPHKVARGYLPQATYSAHWVRDKSFKDAVARYLEDERRYVRQDIDYLEAHTPFRKDIDLASYRTKLSSL
ncbi:MAG: GNAT family N-acetyltransferase [Gammaproteobacteria bacterium]|nr:GNAT family N-acetyltransferase [Gammaproteobacteria bacterium]